MLKFGAKPAVALQAQRYSIVQPRPLACRATSADDVAQAGPRAWHQALDLGLDPLAVRELVYSPVERVVLDERPAEEFFGVPRIGVAHTDAGFSSGLTALYRRFLEPISNSSLVVVDLCSSSASHLPADLPIGKVIGHGVNEQELAANGLLTSSFVQDLNQRITLPVPSASAGAVLCCNGMQYLTRPEWVMAEVCRVLRPGGIIVVSFSSSCWLERAAAGWLKRSAEERVHLVARVLENAGLCIVETLKDTPSDAGADPLFAVVAQKGPTHSAPEGIGADADPAAVAKTYVGPALQEMDLRPRDMSQATPLMLERWRLSYDALVADATELGIPLSAIPQLPESASPNEIRSARDHLQSMIESFLSAGL